jgi:hypothetical protein
LELYDGGSGSELYSETLNEVKFDYELTRRVLNSMFNRFTRHEGLSLRLDERLRVGALGKDNES